MRVGRAILCCFLTSVALGGRLSATDHFVSPAGDDFASGSLATPWQTIARVNDEVLAGDRVFFLGGATFTGTIQLGATDAGTAARPTVIGSYGSGRATIDGGIDAGLYAYNCAGLEIRDLVFRSPGYPTNSATGIGIWMDDAAASTMLEHLVLDNLDVGFFGDVGLWIGSNAGGERGYRNVRVTNSEIHHNRRDGMFTWGSYTTPGAPVGVHENVYVGHCKFYDNTGIYNRNTGNGLYLKDVDGGVIEHCEAYNNGTIGGLLTDGGPVGIWAIRSRNIVIQFNESHHNSSGGENDGGGFDLDAGVADSVMQYNYSHDNEGSGFQLIQWNPIGFPFRNNVVRYNLSQNDALGTIGGGINLWSDADGSLQSSDVYNNTIWVGAGGNPALRQRGSEAGTVRFFNNLFVSDGAPLVDIAKPSAMSLRGNCYWSGSQPFLIRWRGNNYADLAAFRFTGMERLNGSPVGFQVDPLLAAPGGAGTIGNTDDLANLSAYKLLPTSPLLDQGLDLAFHFGVSTGSRDYYGNALPVGAGFDLGAHERPLGNNKPPLVAAFPDSGVPVDGSTYVLVCDDLDGASNLASLEVDIRIGSGQWFAMWPNRPELFRITQSPQGRYVVVLELELDDLARDFGPLTFRARAGDMAGEIDQQTTYYH